MLIGLSKLLSMENKNKKCACCGFLTLEGMFDICPVCYWQKDFFQEEHIDDNGGPNLVSLREAKENFKKYSAIERRFKEVVRLPTDAEKSINNKMEQT